MLNREITKSKIPMNIVNCNSNCDIKIPLDINSSDILSGFNRLRGVDRLVDNASLKPKVEIKKVIKKMMLLVLRLNFSILLYDK